MCVCVCKRGEVLGVDCKVRGQVLGVVWKRGMGRQYLGGVGTLNKFSILSNKKEKRKKKYTLIIPLSEF